VPLRPPQRPLLVPIEQLLMATEPAGAPETPPLLAGAVAVQEGATGSGAANPLAASMGNMAVHL
jgi:hypothetical protein